MTAPTVTVGIKQSSSRIDSYDLLQVREEATPGVCPFLDFLGYLVLKHERMQECVPQPELYLTYLVITQRDLRE